jgi:ankyrin repeat protein
MDRESLAGAPRTLISLKRALHFGPIPGLIVLMVTFTSSALAYSTTIEDAAAASDVVTLRTMLGANPVLALAKEGDAAKGWQELVLLVLANHADVNAKDAHGATPLHAAVFYKWEETVKLLIAQHARIAAVDDDGETPLHMAAQTGSVPLVEMLLANHADINARGYGKCDATACSDVLQA